MSAIATHPNETESLFAELDYRDSDGIEVWLLWNRNADALTVYLCDARADESFELTVRPEHAREVFLHRTRTAE
jgi:hypothetical protein